MTVALVFPPICDPTAPYISVPLLTGWLRSHGVEVLPVDANLEACDLLLRPGKLAELGSRVGERYRELNRRNRLAHDEQGAYLAALEALESGSGAQGELEAALRLLRGEESGFYDPQAYERSIATVERALGVLSAAYAPLTIGFASYRSPFSLLTAEERQADSLEERNPFHGYFASVLIPALLSRGAELIGISVVFPGQIQPAYSLAHQIRADPEAGGVHITVGGPAVTQILTRLDGAARARALEPFDSAVIFEGEEALLDLVRRLERGEEVRGVLSGSRATELARLPPPDFDGLPLDRYLSPAPVLPYDLSRGCPWGRCAFCHYGLAERGTASYRERDLLTAVEHLTMLSSRHGARLFYLSEDSVRPRTLLALAREIERSGTEIRWATDVRPEKLLADPEAAKALRRGGAVAFSFGLESGSERVLELIGKGIALTTARKAIRATAEAGIAAEAMVFTDFPTETGPEAMATLSLLEELRESVALFMCGVFGLTSGSEVARSPERFDIREVFTIEGDELAMALKYTSRSRKPWKSRRDREAIESELERLSGLWRFSSYPWAGSLSTAHTLLWYEHHGAEVFRRFAASRGLARHPSRARIEAPRFAPADLRETYERNEAGIWDTMVRVERSVSRARHASLAASLKPALPRPPRARSHR